MHTKIYLKKIKEVNYYLIQKKEKHKEDINDFSNVNDQPCKGMRDL